MKGVSDFWAGKTMFREMKNIRRKLDQDSALEILLNGEYGVLATNGEDGYNYATPLNYVYINDKIYFHCAMEGHKLDNIKVNNKVSFCVVGESRVVPNKFTSRFESAIVFGRAYITDGQEKRDALLAFISKYSPGSERQGEDYMNRAIRYTCVVKIEIDELSGKAAKA